MGSLFTRTGECLLISIPGLASRMLVESPGLGFNMRYGSRA